MHTLTKLLDKYLLLTLALCVFAIAPLLYPGYFQTHSGFIPLWSVNTLRDNFFNVAWLPALIKFEPLKSGGLFPYYFAAFIPFSSLTAVKLVMGLSFLSAGTGLYLWLKSWIGPQGACVSALVYVYAPFTLATIYVRGAFSEFFFWGFLPLALLAATFLVAQPKWPIMLIAGLFWLVLGLSQLGLGWLTYIFLMVMTLVFHRPQAKAPLLAAAGGLIAATALTIPRGAYSGLPPLPTNLGEHLLLPAQLFSAFWGYGLSQAGWEDGLSLSLGFAAVGLSILTLAIWRGGPDRRPWFFLGVAITSVLLMLPPLGWVWQLPGFNQVLSYPWQLLGFATLGLAVMSGIGFWLEPRLRELPLFTSVILMVLLTSYFNLDIQFSDDAIPQAPLAVYGNNEVVLLDHQFVVDNPDFDPDIFESGEPYIPLAQFRERQKLTSRVPFYLQIRWQAIRPFGEDYKIFGHIVDENNQVLNQIDIIPQNGTRPTSTWLPGEIIEDQYTFQLRQTREGTPTPHQLWLGFYDLNTLLRIPALGDDEGRAIIDVQ